MLCDPGYGLSSLAKRVLAWSAEWDPGFFPAVAQPMTHDKPVVKKRGICSPK